MQRATALPVINGILIDVRAASRTTKFNGKDIHDLLDTGFFVHSVPDKKRE